MADIEARNRGARPHRIAFRQLYAGRFFGIEQLEQCCLFGVVGLGGIAGRRADAGIGLGDELLLAERLVLGIAPVFAPHPLMHALGKSFGEAVGQRLHEDRGIIVVRPLETLGDGDFLDAGRDDEAADIVLHPLATGATKSDSATFGRPSRFESCWRSV